MEGYTIFESEDYLGLRELFTGAGLEFHLDETGLKPEGFLRSFVCIDENGEMAGAAALTKRKGCYILNDIAVGSVHRGKGIGARLLARAVSDIRNCGGAAVFLTAKAPRFFEKYGFAYLRDEEVPDVFGCLRCEQYGRSCSPEFMKLNLAGEETF